MQDTDELQFIDEDESPKKVETGPLSEDQKWKMIIVDDEDAVHKITELVLKDFTFNGKKLEFINAYSAEEAKALMDKNSDIALMFLDVVMESDDAGLLFVKYVRETLKDNLIRIILRTGQPGAAPEIEVAQKYDINDYKQKTELTTQKMYTVVISSLRSYQNIKQLDDIRNNLEKIVELRSAELRKINDDLKVEVEERKRAEHDAEAANQSKSIFLANMSHEIRTPMNAIIGYAEILKRDKQLNSEQFSAINTIERSSNHLLTLINDILDISKIEAGRMELKTNDFNLADFAREISQMFLPRCEEKALTWQIEGIEEGCRLPVNGDEAKLKQVLINLIGNALKFTETGGVILRITTEEDDYYFFEITDTGEGISPESLKTIFEPFKQDEQKYHKGGTGLGLAICDKHVELMGGKLGVQSTLDKGSRFFFRLKFAPALGDIKSRVTEKRKVLGLEEGYKVKAVVVDDVDLDRELMTKSLEDIGVEVVAATNGADAIDKTREQIPNIVFVDYRMEQMDGIETISRIKNEFGDKVKAIIVSASVFDHHLKQFNDSGCDGVISKPFHVEDVYKCMAKTLNIKYKYAKIDEPQSTAASKFEMPEITIPGDLLARMNKAAEFNEITELENLLIELETLGPEAVALADHIRALAKQYDMDGILDVFKKLG